MKNIGIKLFSFLNKIFRYFERKMSRSLFFQNKDNQIHSSFNLGINNILDIHPQSRINIAKGVFINQNNFITIKKNAKFIVDEDTYITRATISCLEEISIGKNCILGEGLKIFDHNHKYTKKPFKVSKKEFNTAPIKIGNNVWTGANCIILKGVTIGGNSIIGAGCVIYKDVPANSIIINKQEHVVKSI